MKDMGITFMHTNNQITPKERLQYLADGRPVDRLPVAISMGDAAKQLLASHIHQNGTIAENIAEVEIQTYKTFGVDGIELFYGLSTFAKVCGASMRVPPIGAPLILQHPMKTLDDMDLICPEQFTVKKESNASVLMDALRIIQEQIGDEVPCGIGFPGAFSIASSMLGIEKLLRSTRKEPEKLHLFLRRINSALINLAADFLREDIPVDIADPVASGTILHAKQFQEFVLPYAQEFVTACKKIRTYEIGCHICGDTTKILDSMVDCGYDSLSLDNLVNLTTAKQMIGSRVPISGNVPPVEVMLLGNPTQVKNAVIECFDQAGDSPCGFTINTGCDCPPMTPMENITAYFEAANRCAKFPYSKENLDW